MSLVNGKLISPKLIFYAHKVYDTNMSCAKCYLYKNSIGCAKVQCLSEAPQPTMFHLEKVEYNE